MDEEIVKDLEVKKEYRDYFFKKEIDEMNMSVSLGIYYDSDSPSVCNDKCYTVITGAEFREVSLVYHAGFLFLIRLVGFNSSLSLTSWTFLDTFFLYDDFAREELS